MTEHEKIDIVRKDIANALLTTMYGKNSKPLGIVRKDIAKVILTAGQEQKTGNFEIEEL